MNAEVSTILKIDSNALRDQTPEALINMLGICSKHIEALSNSNHKLSSVNADLEERLNRSSYDENARHEIYKYSCYLIEEFEAYLSEMLCSGCPNAQNLNIPCDGCYLYCYRQMILNMIEVVRDNRIIYCNKHLGGKKSEAPVEPTLSIITFNEAEGAECND